MKLLPSEKTYGPRGPAKLQRIGGEILIQFTEERKDFRLPPEAFPVPITAELLKACGGVLFVSLSSGLDRVFGLRPLNATVIARHTKIASAEGQPAMPKHVTGVRTGRDGKSYPVDEFTFSAIARVIEGPFKDMELVFPFVAFRRNKAGTGGSGFVDDGEGNLAIRGGGKKFTQLASYLEVTGVWNKPLAYSENPLPLLDETIQKAKAEFMVVLRNGWPESFAGIPKPLKRKPTKRKPATRK